MSRVGKLPITIPAGVTVTVSNGLVVAKGPKGEVSQEISTDMLVDIADGVSGLVHVSEIAAVRKS